MKTVDYRFRAHQFLSKLPVARNQESKRQESKPPDRITIAAAQSVYVCLYAVELNPNPIDHDCGPDCVCWLLKKEDPG